MSFEKYRKQSLESSISAEEFKLWMHWAHGKGWWWYMYTYGWFMLRFDRKQQNSAKQLSFNKKILKRKENSTWPREILKLLCSNHVSPFYFSPQVENYRIFKLETLEHGWFEKWKKLKNRDEIGRCPPTPTPTPLNVSRPYSLRTWSPKECDYKIFIGCLCKVMRNRWDMRRLQE